MRLAPTPPSDGSGGVVMSGGDSRRAARRAWSAVARGGGAAGFGPLLAQLGYHRHVTARRRTGATIHHEGTGTRRRRSGLKEPRQ